MENSDLIAENVYKIDYNRPRTSFFRQRELIGLSAPKFRRVTKIEVFFGLSSMSDEKNNPFRLRQRVLLLAGAAVVGYALAVLAYVSSSYEIGIRSILNAKVSGEPVGIKLGDPVPTSGDTITESRRQKDRELVGTAASPGRASQKDGGRRIGPRPVVARTRNGQTVRRGHLSGRKRSDRELDLY